MTAFLLAAGFGTRLHPLTAHRPKALLPVGGVPMLDHALAHVRAHGFDDVLVNAHHLWKQVARWAHEHDVALQVELPDILGTGGGLRAALDLLEEPVVVVNTDVLSDVDLGGLAAALPHGGAVMALRRSPDASRIGAVETDENGVVRRIAGVVGPLAPLFDPPRTHFTGVHAMSLAAIEHVPSEGEQCVVRTAYRDLVPQGRVHGQLHAGAWVDIGTPAAYLQANLDVLLGRLCPPVDPWSRGERGPGRSLVGPGARIDGRVQRCVIGAGATVPAGADLEECVVWDGVSVPAARLRRAIVHDGGVLGT